MVCGGQLASSVQRVAVLIVAAHVAGCSGGGQLFLDENFETIHGARANIVFTRTPAMLGAVASHLIIDRGTGIEYDGVVVEKREFSTTGGSLAKVGNVLVAARYGRDGSLTRVAGRLSPCAGAWMAVDEATSVGTGENIPLSSIVCVRDVGGLPAYVQVRDEVVFEEKGGQLVARIARQVDPSATRRIANAQFIGSVKSGQKLQWSRSEGWMRLYVVAPNGDMGNAAPFFVRADHTYYVEYRISTATMRSVFEISESPSGG